MCKIKRSIKFLAKINIAIAFILLVFNILTAIWFIHSYSDLTTTDRKIYQSILLCGLFQFIFSVFRLWKANIHYENDSVQWFARLKAILCCYYCKHDQDKADHLHNDTISSVAEILEDVLDIQVNDNGNSRKLSVDEMLIRLAKIKVQQQKLPKEESKKDLLSPDDLKRLSRAKYYSKYAIGAYGWMMYDLEHCCGCLSRRTCNWNRETFLRVTQLPHEDLLLCQLESRLHMPAYYLCIDRKTNSFVIAVRGTLSVLDAITDMHAGSIPFPDAKSNHYAHQGIALNSLNLYNEIIKNPNFIKYWSDPKHKDHNLVITGHSLGAGVASLLTILFKVQPDAPKITNIHGYSYGCPLIVNHDLATHPDILESVTNIVHNDDVISHLSLKNLYKLRANIINASTTTPLIELSENKEIKEMKDSYIPGVIYHITKETITTGCYSNICTVKTIKRPHDAFQNIVVSDTMIFDHLPSYYTLDHITDSIKIDDQQQLTIQIVN